MAPEQDVRHYLKGTNYPASKNESAGTARINGASREFVERLVSMEDIGFSNPNAAAEATGSLQKPEEAEAGDTGNP